MARASRSSDIRLRHPFDPNIERIVYDGVHHDDPEHHDEEQSGRVEQEQPGRVEQEQPGRAEQEQSGRVELRYAYIEIKICGSRMRLEVGGDCGVACGIGAIITILRLAVGT